MAKDLNKVMFTGRLGKDPDVRYLDSGSAITKFSVAANRQWTNADGAKQEDVEWFNVVAWNKLGELCAQYLSKGARIYGEGRLQTRTWEDEQGRKHWMAEVILSEMIMLDTRSGTGHDEERGEDAAAPQPRIAQPPVDRTPARPEQRPQRQTAGQQAAAQQLATPRPLTPVENPDDLPF